MAQFGASIQTAQVTTGNFQTTVDPYVTGFAGYPNNPGERAIPGAAYYDSTGSNSNPWGAPGKYRYVRYYDTQNTALTNLTAPAPVYWTDTTFTAVTPLAAQSPGNINGIAGLLMPNTTAIPGLVLSGATASQTNLNGNWVWICVGGYVSGVKGLVTATTIVAGDVITGSTTAFTSVHSAIGTAAPNRILGYAYSNVNTPSTGLYNLLVTLES